MQSMGRFLVSLLVVAAAIAASVPVSAFADAPSEVWVSDSLGSDDDSVADGTEQHPYKTIQKGVNMVATDGTVKIKAGWTSPIFSDHKKTTPL